MIEFVLGKTGSGKSLYSVSEYVLKELLNENTFIITNLSLLPGEVNAYFQRNFGDRPINAVSRIRLLSDRESRRFYLHRETGVDLSEPTKAELADPDLAWLGAHVSAANASKWRLIYIIDEAHIFFDAREWANVSGAMNVVLSQHRKIGIDRVVFVTQFLKQVELRLREHAAQFSECQNWGMKRFSVFRLPSVFTVSVTYKAPPCPPEYTLRRRFDREIAACYDTTAGVGITGGRPPEVKKQTGIPWWIVIVLLVALGVFLFFGPEWVIKGLFHRLTNTTAAVAPTGQTVSAVPPGPKPDIRETARAAREKAAGSGESTVTAKPIPPTIVEKKPDIWVTGYAQLGNRFRLQMSDGSVVTEMDVVRPGSRIAYVGRTFVEMDEGTRYHFRPSQRVGPRPFDPPPTPPDLGPSGTIHAEAGEAPEKGAKSDPEFRGLRPDSRTDGLRKPENASMPVR